MKAVIKTLATLLAMAMLIGMTAITTFAAESPAVSSVFDGYNLTILDSATPATEMRGKLNDRTVMCFFSVDGREVGSISYSNHWAIIDAHKTMLRLPEGGTLAIPPDGYKDWNLWFVDEYNKLRGMGAGSREEAVATETADTIEEYRQEVIRLVNVEREKEGLPAYIINDDCMEYSQIRAEELMTTFSHTRPNGENAGYEVIHAGSQTPYDAVEKWMNSPPHRAAILNETRVYVGAGCYISSGGRTVWEMYFEHDA